MPYILGCPFSFRRGLLLAGLLWLTAAGAARAQLDSLGGLTGQFGRYARQMPREALFLHLDRPLYLSGETMWFKLYATGGPASRPLALSSVAYVEVLDASQHPVLRGKVALREATGQGSFALPASLASGRYTVRAYTRWMQNFGPEAFFHGTVTVVNTFAASGTVPAPDSAALDAAFFPEGGHLVRGLQSKVAFKVTDRRGRGVAATGTVLDAQGAPVATFSTRRHGMGSFLLTPAAAGPATYTAVVTQTRGPGEERPAVRQPAPTTSRLPAVQDQGYVLSVHQAPDPGQLTLAIQGTAGLSANVLLLAHARQQAAFTRPLELLNGRAELTLDRSKLPDGVSHFTLFNTARQPLCERLYFQVPRQILTLDARTDQPAYAPRTKVSLAVSAGSATAPNSLSVAVYRLDSLNAAPAISIDHYLGLTSELRGTVEDPAYYFTATGPEAVAATDELLLTQGWSRFRWAEVLAPAVAAPAFLPELYGPVVRARLSRAGTTEPRSGLLTYFSVPGRVVRLYNDQSDADGFVRFEPTNFYGPQTVMLQTDPAQDSTSRITLLDPFSEQFAAFTAPAFSLTPHFRADYARRHLQAQVQTVYAGKKYDRYRAMPTDSVPFYGRPSASYRLDEYTRFKVLEEVLREYVPGVQVRIRKDGFHFQVLDDLNKVIFQENPLVLLDGVPVANINRMMAMNPLKIQRLDVVTSRYFQGAAAYDGLVSFRTYKGDLEGFQLDPRVLIQEYEGLQEQREFYAPRYDTPEQQRSRHPDLRELLYWNPTVTTAAGSGASQPLEFFAGDQAGHYLVVVQGLAANGAAGSTHFTFEVKPNL
ncbi:hypothetical protein CDA63_03105 [Hymenobacter amundsenii]|uniref:Macroglobulin domain-containing protein n=1 Tax=Hymenobacter amundsenii TaxID=2006685 RepID=A0A246FPV7_9BACT|nr:hypothetical protein [Hymenobacter amundsenii]OWP64762.1 hypothetical protein CDA63_03105 [Hymenobacter amundsenii]